MDVVLDDVESLGTPAAYFAMAAAGAVPSLVVAFLLAVAELGFPGMLSAGDLLLALNEPADSRAGLAAGSVAGYGFDSGVEPQQPLHRHAGEQVFGSLPAFEWLYVRRRDCVAKYQKVQHYALHTHTTSRIKFQG